MFLDANMTCGVFLGVLVLFARGDYNKKRLCVQYEMDDYNSSMVPLKKMSGVTHSACFVECVRHQQGGSPCRAFHFRKAEGICELLPKDITCMADNTAPGTTYVHLSDCEAVAPWHGIKPSSGPLQWIAKKRGSLKLHSPLGGDRYVVRVLNKGIWLPGRARSEAITERPGGGRITCRSNIQYINSSKPVPYRWVRFTVGDRVPPSAIVAGYWPNGTPLYIVYTATINDGARMPDYYNADSRQIGLNAKFRPGSLRILVSRK